MPNESLPIFADTVTLSNFLGAGEWEFLAHRYGRRLCITSSVLAELTAGRDVGRVTVDPLVEDLQSGRVSHALSPGVSVVWQIRRYRRTLGAGEASCLAQAVMSGGVVATDDRAARRRCAEEGIPVTGTIGILVAGVRRGTLPLARAEDIHVRMRNNGFFSPVERIGDVCSFPGSVSTTL
jgi:predicted nucleic acid-binding protein